MLERAERSYARTASRAALDAPSASPAVVSVVQFVFGWAILGVALTANAFVGWLLVVAPVQHIAYAVLGAPARNALRNPAAPRYDPATDFTTPRPAGGTETGHALEYLDKPVALTSALTASVLWVCSQFVC